VEAHAVLCDAPEGFSRATEMPETCRNLVDLSCLVHLDPVIVIVMPFKPKSAMLHLFLNGLLRFL
jgi:hypothetical protein